MRHSQQRDVILSVLRASTAHPTAEQIYEAVREVLPNVSLGTVYRNIRQLADNGEILTLDRGHAQPLRRQHHPPLALCLRRLRPHSRPVLRGRGAAGTA